jgi:hypothetical protein
VNEAAVLVTVPLGPELIVVCGGVVSDAGSWMVQLRLAGVASVLPAASIARTRKVWEPAARPLYVVGLVQPANAEASREHWNVEPVSDELNVNEAVVVVTVPVGPELIVVCGAVVSIVHVRVAGEASRFPTPSVARTRNVCDPAASPLNDLGLAHAVNAPASSEHANVEPTSVAEKLNVAEVVLLRSAGPLRIVVSGGVVSTVQVRLSGLESVLSAGSIPRTVKVWLP